MVLNLGADTTIAAMRRILARTLRKAGVDSADLDARLLIGHALGLDHAGLLSHADRPLEPEEIRRITMIAARRASREPVARILGIKEFWSLPLHVGPAVLVPRPETETVVEAALHAVDTGGSRARNLRVADLGTGSGALLLALLSELPNAVGAATDTSMAALQVARDNAGALSLLARARFVACDFGAALHGGFDLVVSNPPYVARGDISRLAPEVRDHDPRLALDGGPDGMAAYRTLAADAQRLLAPGGHMVLELGAGQSGAVAALFEASGLHPLWPPLSDLAGIPRVLQLKRRNSR